VLVACDGCWLLLVLCRAAVVGCHPLAVCDRIVVGGLGCRLAVVVVVPVQFVDVDARFGLCRRGRMFVLPSWCQVLLAFFWRLLFVVRGCLLAAHFPAWAILYGNHLCGCAL
jgi:hypothetical protein